MKKKIRYKNPKSLIFKVNNNQKNFSQRIILFKQINLIFINKIQKYINNKN